jgi:DnaJ like chaperone protein
MNAVEIFVVVFCAIMGYLIVDHLVGSKGKHADAGPASAKSTESGRSRDQQRTTGNRAQDRADQFQRQPQWWAILGVNLGASEEEIQRAYRVQISKYHPDKVAHLGEELKLVAARRSTEINLAYREAMRLHGKAV